MAEETKDVEVLEIADFTIQFKMNSKGAVDVQCSADNDTLAVDAIQMLRFFVDEITEKFQIKMENGTRLLIRNTDVWAKKCNEIGKSVLLKDVL